MHKLPVHKTNQYRHGGSGVIDRWTKPGEYNIMKKQYIRNEGKCGTFEDSRS